MRVSDPHSGRRLTLLLNADPKPGDAVWLKVRDMPGRVLQLAAWTRSGGRFRDGGKEFSFPFSRIAWLRPATIGR